MFQSLRLFSRVASFTVLCAAATAAATPASAESLFDFLFGRRPAPQVAPAPVDDRAARDSARQAHAERETRKRAERAAAFAKGGGIGGKMDSLHPEPGVKKGSLAHFSADPTLRAGDVVVTADGAFMIYRGGQGDRAFAPLSNSRRALASLQEASRNVAATSWTARSPLAVTDQVGLVRAVNADEKTKGDALN